MEKGLFCCVSDDSRPSGLYLELDSSMFEIKKASTGGTEFFIKIQEVGWVDNVYLVTDGHYIKASHYIRGYFLRDEKKIIYSVFHARYTFSVPCEKMESHFCYRLDYREEHITPSNYFIVEPYFEQKENG